jgi:hypothetical protein
LCAGADQRRALIACGEAVELTDVVIEELERLRTSRLQQAPAAEDVVGQTAFIAALKTHNL